MLIITFYFCIYILSNQLSILYMYDDFIPWYIHLIVCENTLYYSM